MDTGHVAARPARFSPLRSRNFALFWAGLLTSHTGVWVQSVGQGWLIYQLTNTPVWLGASSLAFALPMLVLPLIGGAVADRFNPITLIRGLQIFMAVATLALAGLTAAGLTTAWHLAAFSLLQGVVLAFDGPARHAVVPDLVEREDLVGAISLFQSSYQLGGFFGPAIAGVILSAVGAARIEVLFALNAFTYLFFAVMLSLLRGVPRRSQSGAPLLGTVTDGIRFVWQRPPLRALLILITVVGVFGRSYIALMPVFARDIFHTDARGLSYLTAAPGVGVIIGAIALSAAGSRRRPFGMIVTAAVVFSLMLTTFALSRVMLISLAVLVVLGAATVTLVAGTSATMQLATPPGLRGRVMSLWAIAGVGLPAAGAMVTASGAAVVGAPAAVACGAAVVLLAIAALVKKIAPIT